MVQAETTRQQKTQTSYVFPFSPKLAIPPLDLSLLGGKGKNLAEMASIGLPVPPGMIISTEACNDYRKYKSDLKQELQRQIRSGLQVLEGQMDAKFGSEQRPLLVSVRSGARASMPGMMDTVLNVGLNDKIVKRFAEIYDNAHLAYDSYRRLISMYADIVCHLDRKLFQECLEDFVRKCHKECETDLSGDELESLCHIYQELYQRELGEPFPQDPETVFFNSIRAVFESWDSERATLYRKLHRIPDDWGTAVVVQAMVFGNKNNASATGVAFTRNPASGERVFYGEYLINAQGEEVVAGIRTPHPINESQKEMTGSKLTSLELSMPEVYAQLLKTVNKLEKHYCDMQDIEFTIDDGRLFMLQTRTGKRTGFAAIKVAIDMIDEGLIDEETALLRVTPEQFTQLLAPIFEMSEKRRAYKDMVAKGLNAGPGAASGRIALTTKQAEMWRQEGISCILVREETNPNDFPGIVAADGVLTARGGSTSHAAVVARGMGKPCVVGCADLDIDLTKRQIRVGSRVLSEGDILSIDGTTGEIYFCALNTSASEIIQVLLTKRLRPEESKFYPYFDRLMRLADKYRKLKIRTNADTIADTNAAFAFGAEGIGLCRTEHMLMQPERLLDVRRMFFSTDPESRQKAIERLLPHQKRDFLEIFKAANGRPVTIRLLDPPLHEFLPHNRYDLQQLASDMNIEIDVLIGIDKRLREQNPMLGFRGCRLGILYPRITEVQVQAILEAALELQDQGVEVNVEIMVPLIQSANEFQHQKALIDTTAKRIFDSKKKSIHYLVGTMIELPRAALTADEIARDAEFFSFGTNDLTQTTLGISRDDSMRFVPLYIEGVSLPTNHKVKVQIMECDPFQCLDEKGVGRLMRLAVDEGRKTRRDLKCGICGEHGGDPETVEFCQRIGINYVSCSPYRVPLARLAAAQAAIRESK